MVADFSRNSNLTTNISKNRLCSKEMKYFGFIVGAGHLKTYLQKVEAMSSFVIPKISKKLRRFLGMTSWYRRIILNCANYIQLDASTDEEGKVLFQKSIRKPSQVKLKLLFTVEDLKRDQNVFPDTLSRMDINAILENNARLHDVYLESPHFIAEEYNKLKLTTEQNKYNFPDICVPDGFMYTGGHRSMHKALQKLKEKHYWPGVTTGVQNEVKHCELCRCNKTGRTQRPEKGKQQVTEELIRCVYIDFMGPYP